MKRWYSDSFLASQRLNAVAISFDGQKIFAASPGALYCFDAVTGRVLVDKPIKAKYAPQHIVAGDGWVAVVLAQGVISLLTEALQERGSLVVSGASWLELYRSSPDGASLYFNPGHPGYAIKRVRVETLTEEFSHPGSCHHLTAAKDTLLFEAGDKLLNFEAGKPRKLPALSREKSSVFDLSTDGALLGYVGSYSIAHLRNLKTNEDLQLQMFWSGIRNVLFSPDQSRLLVSSNEGDYGCFDTQTGRTLYRLQLRAFGAPPLIFTDEVLFVAFSRRIERYNARTGERLDPSSVCSPIKQLGYQRGSLYASFEDKTSDQQVLQLDATSGQALASFPGSKVDVRRGAVLVAGSPSRLLSAEDSEVVLAQIPGRDGCLFAALSPDGRQFVVRDSHWPSQLTAHPHSGAPVLLEKDSYPQHCHGAFSSDGALFALISKKPGLQLYDTKTWELVDSITAEKLRFTSLAFHPDKPQVALIAVNGELSLVDYQTKKTLWSVPLSKKKLKKDKIFPLSFSPDGALLFVAGLESKLQVFTAKGGRRSAEQALTAEATALALGDDGLVYLGLDDCSLVALPGLFAAQESPPLKAPGLFADFSALTVKSCEASLAKADWSCFVPSRDLPPLRALLLALEEQRGVTPLHHACSRQLQALGARLVHANAHHTSPIAYALSHDGRYLAAGSWCGDDYERGGNLSLWEVSTGQCLNAVKIEGGVGWPDHPHLIQWSPDNSRVGLAFSTNAVGSLDPFDPKGAWRGYSYATNGWDRPPAWCWSPEGTKAFIACWGESASTPGGVVPLDQGQIHERSVLWMKGPSAVNSKDVEGIAPHAEVHWTSGGKIVGHNVTSYRWSGQAFAIDATHRELLWKVEVGKPVAFSEDHFVHIHNGLKLHSAHDGRLLHSIDEVVGASGISFTAHSRMALWVEEGAEFTIEMGEDESEAIQGEPGIQVYQDNKLLCHIDASPLRRPFHFIDASSWVWSPEGERGAVLLEDRTVVVYSLPKGAKAAKRLCSFQADQYVNGLLWGASDVIVAVSSEVLQFWSAAGALLASHPFTPEADAARPLSLKDKDLGARFAQNPSFPVQVQGKSEWAVAFENGLVYCPADAQPTLDALLCFVLGAHSWPYRWSAERPREELSELLALKECPLAIKDKEALIKLLSKSAKREVFPPKKRATLADLIQLYRDSLQGLSSGWHTHISEQKRSLSVLLAQLGRVDEAKQLLAEIPQGDYRYEALVAAAEISARFAKEKKTQALAKEFLALAEKDLKSAAKWNHTWVHGALGAAKFALGAPEAAEEHFARARAALSEEVNPFQLYGALATFFLESGEVKRAFDTIAKGPLAGNVSSFLVRFIKKALAAGCIKETSHLLTKMKKVSRLDSFDLLYAVEDAFYAREEPEVLFAWLPLFDGLYLHPHLAKALLALAGKEKDAALTLWRERLEAERQWPTQLAFWVELGTRLDQEASQPHLDALYKKRAALYEKASNEREFLQLLARALLQSQRESEANALLSLAKTDAEKFSLALVLLRAKDNAAAQAVIAATPPKLTESKDALSALARSAFLAQDLPRYQALIEKMHQTGTDWDRRWSAEEAVRLQIELGDWSGVYQSLQKIPASRRATPLKEAAKGAARAGLLAECAFFLLKLPSTDLNDRPNSAFDAIDIVALREHKLSISVR